MSTNERTGIQLSPMKVPKASDVLANELRERILSGEFPEGTGLPAERELVSQTRMSRTTVREALRILEVQGLITIRAGRTGGAFVQQPGEDAMISTVSLLVDLDAANGLIESAVGKLDAFLEANVEWHIAVARASHNELLSGLMVALSRAIYAATEDEAFVDADVRATAVRAHATITQAIRDQDPDAAARRMTRHVHSYAEAMLEHDPSGEVEVS